MKRLLLLLAALLAFGCDDSTVHANIDTFTCAWLPWWMADCSSSAVHDRAVSVLDHGLASAQITCSDVGFGGGVGDPTSGWWNYQATKMQDGSCLASAQQLTYHYTFGPSASAYSVRNTTEAADCSVSMIGPDGNTISVSVYSGALQMTECSSSCSQSVSSNCTGFNLAAFGVVP
jgi:hypothetical protein